MSPQKVPWYIVLRNGLFCFWVILQRCFFIVVMCALAYYTLALNDQGQDLIIALDENGLSRYFWLLQSALIFWSIVNWYTSRVLVTMTNFVVYRKYGIEWWIKYIPRVAAVILFLVAMAAVIKVMDFEKHFWLFIITLIVEMSIMLIFLSRRRTIARKLNIETYYKPYSADKASWSSLMSIKSFRYFFRTVLIGYCAIVILFVLPVELRIAHWFMPGTILLMGISGLTAFLSWLSYYNNWIQRPVFLLLILWVAFCALYNDNTELRVTPKKEHSRPAIEQQFWGWIKHHTPPDTFRSRSIPLLLLATQGGGIRALYWNNKVIGKLDSLYPGFTDHTFAISGVSGGGVGASLYLTYYRDFILNGNGVPGRIDAFSSDDYLSSVTAGLFFSDNFQKFIPISAPFLNRTRKLEDAWSLGYCDQTALHTMDSSFLSLWDLPMEQKYRLPSLMLNGTLAETGQKTVLSNLELDDHFYDVIDVEKILGSVDVPMKTAASLCSRFPIVTSGGLLCKDGKTPFGHIVDGGYAENTGIETILSVYESLLEPIRTYNDSSRFHIEPTIIFIKNSEESDNIKIIKSFIDIRTIGSAFVSAWGRRAPVGNYLASDLINLPQQDPTYFSVALDRRKKQDTVRIPLGWFLSHKARAYMDQEGEKIHDMNPELCKRLERLF